MSPKAQVRAVVLACRRLSRRRSWRNNLVVFELATCAGLCVCEMQELRLHHICYDPPRPRVLLPDRQVPLALSPWLLEDLGQLMDHRFGEGADAGDRLLVTAGGRVPDRKQIATWYMAACRQAGPAGPLASSPAAGRVAFCVAFAAAAKAGDGTQPRDGSLYL